MSAGQPAAEAAPEPALEPAPPGSSIPAPPSGPALASRAADLTRTTFAVLMIGALIAASLWVLRPFVGSLIWAVMVVVATWPLFLRIERRLGGRRWAAVTAMSLLLLLLFAVPLVFVLVTIVDNADRIIDWARDFTSFTMPPAPPAWLAALPFVGERVAELWAQLAATGIDGLLARLRPYAGNVTRWFVGQVGSFGFVLAQFLLTVVIAGFMYAHGETAAARARRFAHRLAGVRGESTVQLAADAIRGVALGVGVTALVQAVLGGAGLAVAGVPFVALLTALMFMLCLAQIGALPVMVPATIWAFYQGHTGWGIFLAVWSAVVGTMDNVLRPLLIRLGADLPLILIFAGVIGGLLAFGLVGIFVGPVLLAVSYTLLESWIDDE